MQKISIPPKISVVWASGAGSGYTNPIPNAPQTGGRASFTTGFPPNNFIPTSAGGTPPFGADMNGIHNQETANIQWLQATAALPWDSAFSTAVGGYFNGAIVQSAQIPGLLWLSTVDNNLSNPDAGGAGWQPFNRVLLTANTSFFVDEVLGSDNNNGLSAGAGGAWATPQHAVDVIAGYYDIGTAQVTVHFASGGSYNTGVFMRSPFVAGAGGFVTFTADGPVTITQSGNGHCFEGTDNASFGISGPFTLISNTGADIAAFTGSNIYVEAGVIFGTSAFAQIWIDDSSNVQLLGNFTINGNAPSFCIIRGGKLKIPAAITTTLTGSPVWNDGFINAFSGGIAYVPSWTFSGVSGSGSIRFETATGGGIYTGTSHTVNVDNSYLPGDTTGVCNTGAFGWYD